MVLVVVRLLSTCRLVTSSLRLEMHLKKPVFNSWKYEKSKSYIINLVFRLYISEQNPLPPVLTPPMGVFVLFVSYRNGSCYVTHSGGSQRVFQLNRDLCWTEIFQPPLWMQGATSFWTNWLPLLFLTFPSLFVFVSLKLFYLTECEGFCVLLPIYLPWLQK